MKLSISLPSIYPAALERTLKNIQVTTHSDHEVLVVSPTRPPNIGNIIWVQDFVNQGCNAGHCQALIKARGEFLFPWVDDHLLKPDWDIVLISEFRAREFLAGKPFMLGVRQDTCEGQIGTVFGIYY